MKIRILLLSCWLGLAGIATAADGLKVATVDLRKVFDNYWKTKQADVNLKDQAGGLEKERRTMVDQYQKAQENYKKFLDGANDQALSTDERDKRKKSAEMELLSLRDLENRVKQFDVTSRTMLDETRTRVRNNILAEIKDTIKAKVKAGNYNLVLDSAADSFNNTPIVLYTAGIDDLSDAILAQLNVNAPAVATPAKSEAKPEKDSKK
jgi:outer membrane protein